MPNIQIIMPTRIGVRDTVTITAEVSPDETYQYWWEVNTGKIDSPQGAWTAFNQVTYTAPPKGTIDRIRVRVRGRNGGQSSTFKEETINLLGST